MKFIILPTAIITLLAATLGLSSPTPAGPYRSVITMAAPYSKEVAFVYLYEPGIGRGLNVTVGAMEATRTAGANNTTDGRLAAKIAGVLKDGVAQPVENYECSAYNDKEGIFQMGKSFGNKKVYFFPDERSMRVKSVRCRSLLECGFTCKLYIGLAKWVQTHSERVYKLLRL